MNCEDEIDERFLISIKNYNIYQLPGIYFLFPICLLESRSNSQQRERSQEDVYVQTSLPPCVDGPVNAILICHIPKLRWLPKYQSICRSITIRVAWWGEDETSATFR